MIVIKRLKQETMKNNRVACKINIFCFPDFAFYMLTLIWIWWCLVVQTNPLTIYNYSKNKHKTYKDDFFETLVAYLKLTSWKRYYSIFIHSLNKYVLINYCESGTVPGVENIAMSQKTLLLIHKSWSSLHSRGHHKQLNAMQKLWWKEKSSMAGGIQENHITEISSSQPGSLTIDVDIFGCRIWITGKWRGGVTGV